MSDGNDNGNGCGDGSCGASSDCGAGSNDCGNGGFDGGFGGFGGFAGFSDPSMGFEADPSVGSPITGQVPDGGFNLSQAVESALAGAQVGAALGPAVGQIGAFGLGISTAFGGFVGAMAGAPVGMALGFSADMIGQSVDNGSFGAMVASPQ